jgi:response regulator RpfG family c-di-GMP phosphodiesterase
MQIAIIDDTPLNLVMMENLVSHHRDCTAMPFSVPREGLRWCLENEPDLIIVDYLMPGLDGVELIRQVRDEHGHDDVPILMVTASNERQVLYRALEAGANDFLIKPVDPYEFKPRVRNMLKLREAHLATRNRAGELADEVRKATAETLARERETVTRLARAAEFRDPETGAHIQRMSYYSALIARQLGLEASFVEAILQAAPMHDVGKLGIPDHILLKPGRLSAEELAVMRRHPEIGHDILKDSTSSIIQLGASIALTHHEKFDGSGYPRQLAGEDIPIEGRIVAVADVFDALTSPRPYKPAWPLARALDMIREGRNGHFDPLCADALLDNLDEVLAIRERFGES